MSEILQAQRVAAARDQTKANQQAVIDEMKQAIGPERYATCKQQLPLIEQAINKNYLPYLAQVAADSASSLCPIPAPLSRFLVTIQNLCVEVPQQLRQAINAYEQLSFRDVLDRDGRSVDGAMRNALVGSIRQRLGSHDGTLSFLENQKAQAENWKNDAKWPSAQALGSAPIVPAREASREIVVETI